MRLLKKEESDYTKLADDFCDRTGTDIKFVYKGHYPSPQWDEKECRAQWLVDISRNGVSESFDYTNSLNNSYCVVSNISVFIHEPLTQWHVIHEWTRGSLVVNGRRIAVGHLDYARKPVSAYDILACLTKYDVGCLDDFCLDFGMDADSVKANALFVAVCAEWSKVKALFHDCLDDLREIE